MMKKRNKNKGKKSLTAVGAVIAAGLTPGIMGATPGMLPTVPDVEFTAADAVAINGEVIDFDELYAMQQVNKKRETAQQKREREQAIVDSIFRSQEPQPLVYGPPPPDIEELKARHEAEMKAREEAERKAIEEAKRLHREQQEAMAARKQAAIDSIQNELLDYCVGLIGAKAGSIAITPDSHLTRDLKMNSRQLEALTQEVENRYNLMMISDELKQLTTLRRLATYIVEVTAPHED